MLWNMNHYDTTVLLESGLNECLGQHFVRHVEWVLVKYFMGFNLGLGLDFRWFDTGLYLTFQGLVIDLEQSDVVVAKQHDLEGREFDISKLQRFS